MKYKVIGWTDYDNTLFEDAPASDAAVHAIVDDIQKNGYLFSGWEHQECLYGAPVLNDGKRRVFSQRGFGAIMAMAHENNDKYGYSLYAFGLNPDAVKMPSQSPPSGYTPEGPLSEEFSLALSKEEYARAQISGEISMPDIPSLRYIDKGDTLLVSAEGISSLHAVEDAERTMIDGVYTLKIRIRR